MIGPVDGKQKVRDNKVKKDNRSISLNDVFTNADEVLLMSCLGLGLGAGVDAVESWVSMRTSFRVFVPQRE